MNIDPEVNARYGKLTIGWYLAVNAFLLVVVAGGSWFFAARANSRGIPPNTALGFRSQHTLSSLHGWYVAQRVGFHFVAVAATVIAVIVFSVVTFAFIRRSNPMWMLFVPVVGDLAIVVCFIIAGQHADQAAISVEKPAALGAWAAAGPSFRSVVDNGFARPSPTHVDPPGAAAKAAEPHPGAWHGQRGPGYSPV